jgi:hypothetical protein
MKRLNCLVVALSAVAIGCIVAAGSVQAQPDPLLAESRTVSGDYQNKLRAQLVTALDSGGPLLALDVCKGAAPQIGQEVGARTGAKVWRVSLQTRNPQGAPDAWERSVLEQFNARRAAGEDPATIEASTHTDTGFRYMKAIPMAELCVQCHGSAVAPDVAAKISTLYPQDRANGFRPGELRGAVSVSWPTQR